MVFNQIQVTRTGNLEDTAVSQGTSPPRRSQQRRVATGCRGRGGRVTENCMFLSPGPPPGLPLYASCQGRSDPIPSRLARPMMVLSQAPSRCGLRQASGEVRRSPQYLGTAGSSRHAACIHRHPKSGAYCRTAKGNGRGMDSIGYPATCAIAHHMQSERQAARSRTVGALTALSLSKQEAGSSAVVGVVPCLGWRANVKHRQDLFSGLPSSVDHEMALRDVYLRSTCIWDGRRDAGWSGRCWDREHDGAE